MHEFNLQAEMEETNVSNPIVHECECPECRQSIPHPEQTLHQQMNLLMSRLDEQQRRLYAALESLRLGHGGELRVAMITGLDPKTIRRGRQELDESLASRPADRVRLPGGGRHPIEKKTRK
jgi:hypothetical protein